MSVSLPFIRKAEAKPELMATIWEADSRIGRLPSPELRDIPDGETGAVNRADSVTDDYFGDGRNA